MTDMIEDLLHILVDNILIADGVTAVNDLPILSSISRQCKKGIGLTDKQHALVKEKLLNYIDNFESHGVNNVRDSIENGDTRLPIRHIDRSKYITVVNHTDMLGPNSVYESYKDKWRWIKIRFPFNKKTIVLIEKLISKYKQHYYHNKGSHEHYFRFHEHIFYDVIDMLIDRNFIIDEDLIERYHKIKAIKETPEEYIPGYYSQQLKNITDSCKEIIAKEIGIVDSATHIHLYDRRLRYGLTNIEKPIVGNLLDNIISREYAAISINPSSYNIDKIADAILTLDRFPLLVLVDKEVSLDQISKVYNAFNGFVSNEKQSALFRVDNNGEYNVNNFIHDKKLNNWLDCDTEIVYISKDTLPKLLLREDWKPITALSLTSQYANTYVTTYVDEYCDLIMYHDVDTGLFKRRYHGFM